MRVALYARVSSSRQVQRQTIEQQLTRLQCHVQQQGWTLDPDHIYRDDGYSGAKLNRPGLDHLRDRASFAEFDVALITEPDRLARRYVHQVLLIEELEQHGCRIEFVDRPMSQDPHDQLLLQIRGAVAEYERTLIAERMRRGRQAKLRAGKLLPWTRPLFGYRLDPDRPRDPSGVRVDAFEATVVQRAFAWYLELGASLYRVAKRLTDARIATPTGRRVWSVASLRGILRNPAYTGTAYANRTRSVPARHRRSALLPVGPGESTADRPRDEWIPIPVPAIVAQEVYDQVQEKLDRNKQFARRNNNQHDYLLRGLVSCGACRLSTTCRTTGPRNAYGYYVCRGRSDRVRAAEERRCQARYVPAPQLDELVWNDLCRVLTEPALIARALERARGGHWLPQELQSRQAGVGTAIQTIERQEARLLDAYLAQVLELPEFERKRGELRRHLETLQTQQRQLEAIAQQRIELAAVADSIAAFCATVRDGLADTTFAQRRTLVELLVDRVIVFDGAAEIRYVIPTAPDGPHQPFCHLRLDYLDPEPSAVELANLKGPQLTVELDEHHPRGPTSGPPPATTRIGSHHHDRYGALAIGLTAKGVGGAIAAAAGAQRPRAALLAADRTGDDRRCAGLLQVAIDRRASEALVEPESLDGHAQLRHALQQLLQHVRQMVLRPYKRHRQCEAQTAEHHVGRRNTIEVRRARPGSVTTGIRHQLRRPPVEGLVMHVEGNVLLPPPYLARHIRQERGVELILQPVQFLGAQVLVQVVPDRGRIGHVRQVAADGLDGLSRHCRLQHDIQDHVGVRQPSVSLNRQIRLESVEHHRSHLRGIQAKIVPSGSAHSGILLSESN